LAYPTKKASLDLAFSFLYIFKTENQSPTEYEILNKLFKISYWGNILNSEKLAKSKHDANCIIGMVLAIEESE
ncbi:hypothetical protein CON94_23310, partial [Bacillus pseudomycoides]|uniref:hypothetical protein n=2 Tax=Bacillus pseudomycoides TaxID=64104 RepID=UPI000BED9F84